LINAPILAAITIDPTGGGVAAVSRLLWRVFQERWGSQARLLTMFSHQSRPATLLEKTKFTMALASTALGESDWILFSHLGLAEAQGALPARLRRPYGVFLHGIEAWGPLDRRALNALAGAEVRIANSQFTAKRIMTMHPTIGAVDACPLALPSDQASEQRAKGSSEAVNVGPLAVLAVGRMARAERYKGHDQLIDAWTSVVGRVPDAQLVLVGDGDDRERLMRKASSTPAGRGILFPGFVTANMLEGLYRRAALFALPSRGEGFGLVYLEAMTHGLPCVASIHDAAVEVIADGETGRLVDQDDVEGLAGTLAGLLTDPSERRRLGDAGTRRALDAFSFERFRDRMCALLPASPVVEADVLV
jgi:phosphatidylinositol alpha-1,6-mannosyltransferase